MSIISGILESARKIFAKELDIAIKKIDPKWLTEILEDTYSLSYAKNIERQLQKEALISSSKYAYRKLYQTKSFTNKYDILEFALSKTTIANGLYCEFGVYMGETINFIANRISHQIHGFDSFDGLPELWREGFDKKMFKVDDKEELKFANNVLLHVGLFGDSLANFTKSHTTPIAFMHVDCDLYSSTQTIFNLLGKQLISGSVIVFDEYFNYPGWQYHEFKAFQEFMNKSSLKYEYIAYNKNDEQVAVLLV